MTSEPYIAQRDFFVRYAETDASGLVHHSSYVLYCEDARVDYVRQRGRPYETLEAMGYFIVVGEMQFRFMAAARFGDELTSRCWIEEVKSRRIVFAYEIRRKNSQERLISAKTSHFCITKEGQATAFPPAWRLL